MFVFHFVEAMRKLRVQTIEQGKKIGFAPTMGALHTGHDSLIFRARDECDIVVVSIFVNPTQFNHPADLEKYPRPIDADLDRLFDLRVDIAFLPTIAEVYPQEGGSEKDMDLKGLDEMMEGAYRPGHFRGVAQVMKRLLEMVEPHKLYMGQKDFQQVAIIRELIKQLEIDTEMIMCPIKRHPDGLAMSSRNVRLTPKTRQVASIIYQTLCWVRDQFPNLSVAELEHQAMSRIEAAGLRPEYFSIIDKYNLQPFNDTVVAQNAVACTAAWAGDVRLIDNMILPLPASTAW